MSTINLKEEIKNYANSIGADLVGFGNIGRCKHAPLRMSPQGKTTKESLAAALVKHDPIKKYRPVACEPCVINCPYSREQHA